MESSYRQIWRIAWPVMVASLAQNAVSLIDTVFLGLLGRTELAAGGIGVVLFLTIGFIGLGLGTGVQVLSAQALGRGEISALASLFMEAIWIGTGIGLLLTVTLWKGAEPLILHLLHEPETQQTTIFFLKGRSFELFPLILFGVLRGYYSGTAQTVYILRANLLLAFSNVLLNAFFVLGLGWGLRGVIVGSVAAQYLATTYLFLTLRVQTYPLRGGRFERKWLYPLFRYAGPSILQNLVGMVGWFVFFLLIERRGSLALASANVVRSLYSFCMLPTWALSTAVGTLTGYFWGARQRSALLQSLWKSWYLSQSINGVLAFLLVLFAPIWVHLFSQDPLILLQAQRDLSMIAVSLVLMPASALLISAVVGVGQVLIAFFVEVAIILLYVGYAFTLDRMGCSLTWLWSAEWVYWVPSAVVLGFLLAYRLRTLQPITPVTPQ
ncbi:MAG: MATE family efflux transporter [Bacteroidia bacterium]|nr:MATE family efflux transporter [Bacteroidia bacterium]